MEVNTEDGTVTIEYDVHHVINTRHAVPLDLNGTPVQAEIDGVEVEMMSEAPNQHGSLILRFSPPHLDAIREMFQRDGRVAVSFKPVSGPRRGATRLPEGQQESPGRFDTRNQMATVQMQQELAASNKAPPREEAPPVTDRRASHSSSRSHE